MVGDQQGRRNGDKEVVTGEERGGEALSVFNLCASILPESKPGFIRNETSAVGNRHSNV